MNLNRNIAKGLAVLFLLMLGQKIGVGLFLHNVLHVAEKTETKSSDTNSISFACNCIDDFSSPFTETSFVEITSFSSYPVVLLSFTVQSVPLSFYLFNSLRAPPSFIA